MLSSSIWGLDERAYGKIHSQLYAITAAMTSSEASARGGFGCGEMLL